MGQMPTPLRSGRGRAQCSRSGGGRRLLLLAAVAALGWLALACTANDDVPPAAGSRDVGSEAPAPIDNGVPSGPTDTDTPPDTAGDDPTTLEADPLIWVAPKDVRQGSAFVVAAEAPGAGFASVAFNGDVYTLVREGSRFFAILGIDALTPIGPMPLVVSVSNAEGRPVLQQETLITVLDAAWQTEVVELDESNAALLDPEIGADDAALIDVMLRRETQERHWDGVFDPPSNGVITANYGLLRSYNFLPVSEYHAGLDFAGENGDPILAPNAGVVVWVGQSQRRGNGLLIDHGVGLLSSYWHLSEVVVAPGDVVRTGDFIGRIGATGLATGPHLHWEMAAHGVPIDPVQWIRVNEFPNPLEEFDPADAVQSPNQRAG